MFMINTLFLSQEFLTAQEKQAQELAALELQQRLEELLRKNEDAAKLQNTEEEEMVENIFNFLPTAIAGQEGPAPEGFEVRVTPDSRIRKQDINLTGTNISLSKSFGKVQ